MKFRVYAVRYKMHKCQCMKFSRSIPVAPQGRGKGTFLIL